MNVAVGVPDEISTVAGVNDPVPVVVGVTVTVPVIAPFAPAVKLVDAAFCTLVEGPDKVIAVAAEVPLTMKAWCESLAVSPFVFHVTTAD